MTIMLVDLLKISIEGQAHKGFCLTESDWQQLFQIAQEQAVAGVCFVGVQRLKVLGYNIPEDVYFEWLGLAAQIHEQNERMNRWTAELYETIVNDGMECCVLKGQALARLYRHVESAEREAVSESDNELAMLRQSGDIDIWILTGHKDAIRWGQKNGGIWYYDYHHADLMGFHHADVELHYRPTLSRNLWRNAKLQKWFKKEGKKLIDKGGEFSVPNDMFNLILVLNHNFWHLMYEGVGMRQTMDLFFILRTVQDLRFNVQDPGSNTNIDSTEISRLLKYFRLKKFAAASMWVMKEVFGLPEEKMVCKPDEKSGQFLLQEIMKAGNFGHADERLKSGRYDNRIKLMLAWMKHTFRLFRYYPTDVLWTPIGVLYFSLWRRWHYVFDGLKLENN